MSRISFALWVLPFAACGDGGSTDIKGTLRFADRGDVEIARLVNAAMGTQGFQARATAWSYASPFGPGDPDPCPARTLSGHTGTITGGCTTQDGVSIEGSIAIENPLNWCLVYDPTAGFCHMEYEGNFSAPTIYTFDGFTITEAGLVRSFDGVFTEATPDRYFDMDITSVQLDIAVRSDIHRVEDASGNASVRGGGIELVGVGGALVDGELSVSSPEQTNGSFTLDGADTLKATIANNCTSWRIEGTQRMFSTCP